RSRSKARSAGNKASLYHGFASTWWCRNWGQRPAADRPGPGDGLPLLRRHHVGRVPVALHEKTLVTRLVRNCALGRVTRYSRDVSDRTETPRRIGFPAFVGNA